MTHIMDTIKQRADFRAKVRAHQGMSDMARTDPERLGRFWGAQSGSTMQRIMKATLIADALELDGEALDAFNRGRDAGMTMHDKH